MTDDKQTITDLAECMAKLSEASNAKATEVLQAAIIFLNEAINNYKKIKSEQIYNLFNSYGRFIDDLEGRNLCGAEDLHSYNCFLNDLTATGLDTDEAKELIRKLLINSKYYS
jgi:hypothetical protein